MVWYASQIFAKPSSEVRATFAAHPTLSRGMYLVNHLEGESAKHELPPNGLLVVREVCAPGSAEAEYHGPDALSWDGVSGSAEAEVLRLSQLPYASNGKIYYDNPRWGIHPPLPFLRYLKEVSARTDTVISFYHHFSGAEKTTIQELAWVFDKQDCVYAQHIPRFYGITRFTATETTELPRGTEPADKYGYTVLQRVLRHFGLDLPSSYFALHTRMFGWANYKV